jgi:hypothetical protein
MPRKLTSQEFDSLVQNLERMADGIARHKSEEGYPNQLNEEKRRNLRKQLEEFRSRWEKLVTEADRAYDDYAGHFELCSQELSKDHNTLRGYYGKDSAMLIDYGTKTLGKPNGRSSAKKKPPSQQSGD